MPAPSHDAPEHLKALLKVVVAAEQPLEGQRGLTGWETLYKWLIHTSRSGQPDLW
jgi:hypothetical protein